MNKWIKQQLNKCNFDLPLYDDTTNIIIPKKTIDNIVKKSKEK